MKRVHRFTALFCATFAVAPLAVSAAPITVPSGLNPGDQYRLAFVTSTTRDALSFNVADYNAFVTTVANSVPELAALGTTWSAIVSTLSVDARDNTGTNPSSTGVPIYTVANTRIASNNSDLWDGTINNPLNVTEVAALLQGVDVVYTGTNSNGIVFSNRNVGAPNVISGHANDTDFRWVQGINLAASFGGNFYALSGVLTVPEPSTMLLACLAAAWLAVPSLRRRRKR
jgi:hypothetical protein